MNELQSATRRQVGVTRSILTEAELICSRIIKGKRQTEAIPLPFSLSGVPQLLAFLWEQQPGTVWIMPTSRWSEQLDCAAFEQIRPRWLSVVRSSPRDATRPVNVLLWPQGGERREAERLVLVFPVNTGWNWQIERPRDLLATVTYGEHILERPLLDAPPLLAAQLLRELAPTLPAANAWFSIATEGGKSQSEGRLPAEDAWQQEMSWIRPLTLAEHRSRYLHKYRHFSLAVEGCMSLPLGTGNSVYTASGRACDGTRSGIWRVAARRVGSIFNGKQLPLLAEKAWMSTPLVRCCQDAGYRVEVLEGIYWPQAQPYLSRWATTIWEAAARLHLQPQLYTHERGRVNAIETLRQLASITLAQFQLVPGLSDSGSSHWWMQIVGKSQAVLSTHLVQLAQKGIHPVLIADDAFWVISTEPDPQLAVPGLLTRRPWSGYSAEYQVPLPLAREVKALFAAPDDATQVATILDGMAKEG